MKPIRPPTDSASLLGRELAGDDPEQSALANPVRADDPDVSAGRHAEAHAREQQVAAGMGVGEIGADHVGHRVPSSPTPPGTRADRI
jgi:hypothetical protein